MKARWPAVVLGVVATIFVVGIVAMVVGSLRRPEVATHSPSPAVPREVGDRVVGPLTYTVDATAHDRWVYFDFSRRSVIESPEPGALEWDLAFQRHRMMTNGGDTNPAGRAGVLDLGPFPLDSAITVPAAGYVTDERRGDISRNPLLEDWYDYSWTSHLLRPADRTYAIRTADGRYAVVRFLGYYCPGAVPGCITFRYRYRGDGGRRFGPTDPS